MTAERERLAEFLESVAQMATIPAHMRASFQRSAELLLMTKDVRDQQTRPGSEGHLRLRRILPLACSGCGHQWIAPAIGSCPKCHGQGVEQQGDERTETAPRV